MLVPFLEARIKHSGQMVGLLTCLLVVRTNLPKLLSGVAILAPRIQWYNLLY